jgi:ABC-2 type transport system permease protein
MLRKALWDLRWSMLGFSLGGAGYVFLVSLFYPAIRAQAATFKQLLANYPRGMLTAFGYTDMTTFSGYMGVEALNLIWPATILAFATVAGSAVVAQEIESGTSEIWLSVPARRWRLLLGKMAALGLALLVAVIACAVALALSAAVVNATVKAEGVLAMSAVMAAFLFLVAAYSCLFSALSISRGAAAGISTVISLGSYLLWVVGSLDDSWRWLKNVSIFTAYTPERALLSGRLEMGQLLILAGLTLICVILALATFERRDAAG